MCNHFRRPFSALVPFLVPGVPEQIFHRSVGSSAEKIILEDYLKHVGRRRVYPWNEKDFSDFTAGFANMTLYTSFLKDKNPDLSVSELLLMRVKGLRSIPDICTHDEPRRTEYYEIKPNSDTGIAAGEEKLANIDAFNSYFNLPYRAGRIYKPDNHEKIHSATYHGIKTTAYFHYERKKNGLIVYEMCIENHQDIFMPVAVAENMMCLYALHWLGMRKFISSN